MLESNSEEQYFADALEEVLTSLDPHLDFFRKLNKAEGQTELFIGLFGEGNIMHEIRPYAMWKAARMRIGLCFDIYPPARDGTGD